MTVDVYNGGSTPGLANSVSQALAAQGYKQGVIADAAAQSRAVRAGTQVLYGQGVAANGARIAKYFGAHAAAAASLAARHVEVLLGSHSTGMPAALPAVTASAAQAPPVSVPGSNTSTCGSFIPIGSTSCGGGGNGGGGGGNGNPAPAPAPTAGGNGNGGGGNNGGPNFLPL